MYGTTKRSSSNLGIRMAHLLRYLSNREQTYSPIITYKVMHGIIDFMRHMILMG
jgi:hypothetical protein